MDVRLDGRTALITGASEGLGLAMAKKFAESGANVAMVSRSADTVSYTHLTLPTIYSV